MSDLDYQALQELLKVKSRLRRLLDRALLPPSSSAFVTQARSFEPPVDVWESDDEIIVESELPDASSRNIQLNLEGDELVISGVFGRDTDPGAQHLRVERPRGPFHRRIRLPAETSGVPTASLRRGVLRVHIEKARRHTIPIGKDAT